MAKDNPILRVLGIESSCDDTAAAVIEIGSDGTLILSSKIAGQAELHAEFGGVVPEIAARAHAEKLDLVTMDALQSAQMDLDNIDLVAVTAGPGLIGGVMSGVMFAKGLVAGSSRALIGVNHLAGHALTPRLTDGLEYPYLMLLVSGGHCQYLAVSGPEEFTRLGGTIDDAPGEAFDKVAKLLGLGYPGGPLVQAEAENGDPARFKLPRPLMDRPGCDLSFSGLKTAVLRARDQTLTPDGKMRVQDRADLCASFQFTVSQILIEKSRRAIDEFMKAFSPKKLRFAIAGGVAANSEIREGLQGLMSENNGELIAPPLQLCTDNAAMIAYAGGEQYLNGRSDDLTLSARPRWPLDTKSSPMLGSGKKGAKA